MGHDNGFVSFTECFFFPFIIISRLLSRLLFPFLIHKIPRTNGSGFWIPVIQVFGSFNLLLSIVVGYRFSYVSFMFSALSFSEVCFMGILALQPILSCFSPFTQMSINFLKFEKSHWWQSCYVWAGCPLLMILLTTVMLFPHFVIHICFFEWMHIS